MLKAEGKEVARFTKDSGKGSGKGKGGRGKGGRNNQNKNKKCRICGKDGHDDDSCFELKKNADRRPKIWK